MSDIVIRLQEIVGEQLGMEPENVELNADWVEDLGADSLDLVTVVVDIEYEFGIDIDLKDQSVSKIRTVQDALNYIQKALKN